MKTETAFDFRNKSRFDFGIDIDDGKKHAVQMIKILVRGNVCRALNGCSCRDPKVVFAHITGRHSGRQAFDWVLALAKSVNLSVPLQDCFLADVNLGDLAQ